MAVLEVLFFFIFGIIGMVRVLTVGDSISYGFIAAAILCFFALLWQSLRNKDEVDRFKENQEQQNIDLEKQKIELEMQRLELEKKRLEIESQKK